MAGFTTTSRWRALRLQILERDGHRCRIRGPHCKGKATEVDHIVPVADGGLLFDPGNLRAACDKCNTWRAQRQKSQFGWKRADTHITLVMGPPGACHEMLAYIEANSTPGDLVIDYRSLAAAIGDRPDEVKKLRNSLIVKLKRGEVEAPRAWLTSTNPKARDMFPHHDVVVIDPGREQALTCVHAGGEGLVDTWYAATNGSTATVREW